MVLFHLLDPDELDLALEDLTHFEGLEPGDDRKLLGDPRELRQAFQRASEAFRAGWRDACLDARVEYQLAVTNTPPSAILRQFLLARQKGRPRALTALSRARVDEANLKY